MWQHGERVAEGVYRVDGRTLIGHWWWIDAPEDRFAERIEIREAGPDEEQP